MPTPRKHDPAPLTTRFGVVVLGSINLDTTLTVSGLPLPGETIVADALRHGIGGKGLNQAVAAARHRAVTAMIACVGDDDGGAAARRLLAAEGVSVEQVRTVGQPTGSAVVLVDRRGENVIVVAASANGAFTELTRANHAMLTRCEVLLCQLEVPLRTVGEALGIASEHGALTVLNAAPATVLGPELNGSIGILVVNLGEARTVAASLPPARSSADEFAPLLAIAPEVVVTRGRDGADYLHRDGARAHLAAPVVQVRDSTGAGDAFCGAMCAGLAAGMATTDAVALGVTAGADAVGHLGAHGGSAADEDDQPVLHS